jgi:HK97 family phage prohead protease
MNKIDTYQRIVTRDAYVRSTSEEMIENRQVEFVISTESVDSYGTVFRASGWDLNRYLKNPVVCYQHRSGSDDPDNIIGTSTVRVEDDKLIGVVTFEDAETNPKAEKVFRKVVNGTLKMASVGARVHKARFGDKEKGEDENVLYFERQELYEWSVVAVGANPDAHKRNQITLDEMIEDVKKEVSSETSSEEGQELKRSVREAQLIINS